MPRLAFGSSRASASPAGRASLTKNSPISRSRNLRANTNPSNQRHPTSFQNRFNLACSIGLTMMIVHMINLGMSVPRSRDDVIASRLADVPDHTIGGYDLEKVSFRSADRDRSMLGELAENL
jgi:hypothetical protein